MPPAKRTLEGAHKAEQLVKGGMSISAASKQLGEEYGVTSRTIRDWVKRVGIVLPSNRVPNFQDFNEHRRAEVGNSFAELVVTVLDQLKADAANNLPIAVRDLQGLAITFGILTDKRRLEDGLATDRTETTVPGREVFQEKIDELAERRSKKPS